jgi:A/G-specific adenine glycosylase
MRATKDKNGMTKDDRTIEKRRRILLAWYDRQGRDLPWRRHRSLYGTWISEIMLQQTTVAAVAPRWTRFLEIFPDVAALAAADEQDILAAWSGLGYYRRARLLHRAAKQVMDELGGRLPATADCWRDLPGIGDYAAGAIASIGLGLAEPAIDANVRRVLTRWTCTDQAAASALKPRALRELAARHLAPHRPGDWNQALMDLGAGPCRAGQPDCGACPVRGACAAGRSGQAALIPPPDPRQGVRPVLLSSLVVTSGDRFLVLPSTEATVIRLTGLGRPRRDDLAGLFSGMLSLPLTPWYADGGEEVDVERGWTNWLRRCSSRSDLRATRAGVFRHAITRFRMRVLVSQVEWPPDGGTLLLDGFPPGAAWLTRDDAAVPLSSLAAKALSSAR